MLILLGGLVGSVLSPLVSQVRAQVIGVVVPPPEQLRFRLVGDEPIATADGHSIVAGYKVLVFRDTGSARCYVAFLAGASISANLWQIATRLEAMS
jgi:hypothetical protein